MSESHANANAKLNGRAQRAGGPRRWARGRKIA